MWFTVSLLFEAIYSPADVDDPLWEEIILLIKADSEEEAALKAEKKAKDEEISYESVDEHKVTWKFRQIERVCLINEDTLIDGLEIFSRFLKDTEAKSLLTKFD
jgi:hypothetical protein